MTMIMNEAPTSRTVAALSASLQSSVLALCLGTMASAAIWFRATALEADAKIVLIVTIFAVIGWVATRLPDSLVALLAALALVLTGAQPEEALTNTLWRQRHQRWRRRSEPEPGSR